MVLGNERITGKRINALLYFQTGVVVFTKHLQKMEHPMIANANAVHQRMDNGLSVSFQGYIDTIKYHMEMMESIIGFNPVTAGAAPQPRASVTGQQIASGASDNAIYFLTSGLKDMMKNIGNHTALMIQNICEYKGKPYEALIDMVGQLNVGVIESMSKLHLSQFGIELKEEFSEQEKQDFLQEMQTAYNNKDIDFSDLLMARNVN